MIFVSNVDPNGPSKKAGIEPGDVILKFNNIEIKIVINLFSEAIINKLKIRPPPLAFPAEPNTDANKRILYNK